MEKLECAPLCMGCQQRDENAEQLWEEGEAEATGDGEAECTRRALLGRLGRVALVLASGAAFGGVGCVKQVAYEAPIQGGWALVPRAKLVSLKDAQTVLSLRAGGWGPPIYLRKLSEGYVALLSRCSHRGCEVDAEPDGYECPCHGARFDRMGARLAGPARSGLVRYPVVEKAEGVWIDLRARGGGR
ncbi:Rieske 2Fe-2S domain-containing protein [Myxococcota bacterium]|nr:Rieske 2Fe-2S domain-containing protein [Myxococcota bacterium]